MSYLDNLNSKFQNLSTTEITKAMSEHQNTFVKGVLIVGSLLLLGVIFNDYRIKDQNLRTRMSQVQEKLEAIKARDEAVGKLRDFRSSLPNRLNEFELITLISNYAKLDNVVISSLSPAESKDMGLYDVIKVSFDAQSDDFKDMMLFLRKIEKSNFPLRIDNWSGNEEDDGKITFIIEITAVIIHP